MCPPSNQGNVSRWAIVYHFCNKVTPRIWSINATFLDRYRARGFPSLYYELTYYFILSYGKVVVMRRVAAVQITKTWWEMISIKLQTFASELTDHRPQYETHLPLQVEVWHFWVMWLLQVLGTRKSRLITCKPHNLALIKSLLFLFAEDWKDPAICVNVHLLSSTSCAFHAPTRPYVVLHQTINLNSIWDVNKTVFVGVFKRFFYVGSHQRTHETIP